MPANLSPDFKKAEQAYRAARDDDDRLACLKDMLRTIPKHKGTEHLQADIKSRIKELGDALAGPRKGASRIGPLHSVRREGAAQVALIGPPNSGKSSLHVALTGSHAPVGPYPHTTHEPLPGMLPYQDVHFQLVDLPPVTESFIDSWYANALQTADAALLVVDIADPEVTDQLHAVIAQLGAKRITLSPVWPGPDGQGDVGGDDETDPFRLYLPALLVANKTDLDPDPEAVSALTELAEIRFPAIGVSVKVPDTLAQIAAFLFIGLGLVRVYTKAPGKPAAMDRPFTVRAGATVLDVAGLVHKDIAGALRFARAWGKGVYDGQQVGPEHVLADGDVIELHIA